MMQRSCYWKSGTSNTKIKRHEIECNCKKVSERIAEILICMEFSTEPGRKIRWRSRVIGIFADLQMEIMH